MKTQTRPTPSLQNLATRHVVLKRLRGMWKGARGKEIIREMRQARKSWEQRVPGLFVESV
jgi:hypothetical protein